MNEFVVDASVVLTWCFPDEHSPEAARILKLIRSPENRVVVPSFFLQEVLNAVLSAERRNRITSAAGREFLADFLTMPFVIENPNGQAIRSIEVLSRKHTLTAYDVRLRIPLATFDMALLRASKAENIDSV